MITLITGAPGSGKTLLLVSEFLEEAESKGRPVVSDGIPELSVDHEPAPEVKDWTKTIEDPSSQDGKKLLFTFAEGSLVCVDECQRIFRPRASGKAVPPEVAAFETHRHQGLDFILITQHPNLLDTNVRRLVGRHLHIRDLGILGRKIYEWPEASDPEKFKSAPIQRRWSLPKNSFRRYKSSSLHIKPKRGMPKGVLALALSVPVLIASGFYLYRSIEKKTHPERYEQPKDVTKPGETKQALVNEKPVIDPNMMLVEFDARIPGRPESAPAYDAIRIVKQMPEVVGCVQSKKRCDCFTQQGTNAGLDANQCKQWVARRPFNAYEEIKVAAVENDKKNPRDHEQPKEAERKEVPRPIVIADSKQQSPNSQ